MVPSQVIWEGNWLEILNGCEHGASDEVFLGGFWLDPNKGM